jgi:putative oxidoreductase
MKTLLETDKAWSSLVLRVMLGLVMFPHGAQKMLGWYGGFGFSGTMGFFTEQMHLPAVIAFLVIVGELFGSLGLIAGFLTRFTAASYVIIMLGAIAMVHWPNGFFMNWSGKQPGEGFEYHLLVIGMSLALLIAGGGKWSVDGAIAKKL